MKLLFFFSTFLSLSLLYLPKSFGEQKPTFSLDPRILNIKVTDIFSEGSNQVGDGRIETSSISPSLSTAPTPSLTTNINKTVENLWQMEVSCTQDESQLKPEYYLVSKNGTQGRLSTQNNSNEIKVTISNIPLKAMPCDTTTNTKIVEGGATFELDLSSIKTSGSYSGTLNVTITGI